MRNRSCPGRKNCRDYDSCEDCLWGKIVESNGKLKKKNKELWGLLRKMYFVLTGSNDESSLRAWVREEKANERKEQHKSC